MSYLSFGTSFGLNHLKIFRKSSKIPLRTLSSFVTTKLTTKDTLIAEPDKEEEEHEAIYAVVEYFNYHKRQYFDIKMVTKDVELAKKVAFNNARKHIRSKNRNRITTKSPKIFI